MSAGMRKALGTLVRTRELELAERRRAVAEIERQAERIRAEIERLEAHVAAERAALGDTPDALNAFHAYAEAVRVERARLHLELAGAERRIERAREAVTEAFREQKKLEIALGAEREREAVEASRRETAVQDESAIQRHNRRRIEH